jgi:hypothetical protein
MPEPPGLSTLSPHPGELTPLYTIKISSSGAKHACSQSSKSLSLQISSKIKLIPKRSPFALNSLLSSKICLSTISDGNIIKSQLKVIFLSPNTPILYFPEKRSSLLKDLLAQLLANCHLKVINGFCRLFRNAFVSLSQHSSLISFFKLFL